MGCKSQFILCEDGWKIHFIPHNIPHYNGFQIQNIPHYNGFQIHSIPPSEGLQTSNITLSYWFCEFCIPWGRDEMISQSWYILYITEKIGIHCFTFHLIWGYCYVINQIYPTYLLFNDIMRWKDEGCPRNRLSWGARLSQVAKGQRDSLAWGQPGPLGQPGPRAALVQSQSTGEENPVHPNSFLVNNIISYLVILPSTKQIGTPYGVQILYISPEEECKGFALPRESNPEASVQERGVYQRIIYDRRYL